MKDLFSYPLLQQGLTTTDYYQLMAEVRRLSHICEKSSTILQLARWKSTSKLLWVLTQNIDKMEERGGLLSTDLSSKQLKPDRLGRRDIATALNMGQVLQLYGNVNRLR